jgi:hypothetical protein
MGMKKEQFFKPGNRYEYDFSRCTPKDGWAQLDTSQDAEYFGNWVNPLQFELMSYCEGDVTHTRCDNEEDFKTTLAEAIKWHRDAGYFKGIDPMGADAITAAFVRLGFKADLH